jgi:amidase
MDAHAFASATQLAGQIRDRNIGCLELLDHFLARTERYNPDLNAVVATQADKARDRARAADAALAKGEVWGPLHGVPMTVKESFDVEGMATTWGNPVWKDKIATSNAVLIERLLKAGAVIYGKTNVPLMLQDSQSYNDVYGTTNNPWDKTCGPGGSSGGEAAALSAGLSVLGAGSDIAGSLRNPAHYCGIYAHKPTWGLVPTRGHSPAASFTPTDISVVGPMARHAEDLRLVLPLLAGPDVLQQAGWKVDLAPPRHTRLAGFRVGVWTQSPVSEIDATVTDRFAAAITALRQAGATVDENARPPFDDDAEHQRLFMTLLRAATGSRMRDEDFAAQMAIAATLSPDDTSARANIARGATMPHRTWGVANEQRSRLRYAWRDFFQKYDVLLAPVGATAAFPHNQNPDRDVRVLQVNGKPVNYNDQLFWAGPASLSYLPATAAPLGLTPAGLPVGTQIIGAEGEDLTTIEFARLLADEIGGFVPPPDYR